MRNRKYFYQYGENPMHVVRLTKKQADAVNNIRLSEEILEIGDDVYVQLAKGSEDVDIDAYNEAAEELNAYLELVGGVEASEEYLEDHDILTRI